MRRAARLYPLPGAEIPAEEIYEDLELSGEPPGEHENDSWRPYVVINTVSTLDGKVSRDGISSGIGSDLDRRMMRVIRSRADAVLVGAGTIRAEKLNLTVPEGLANWRENRGKSSQPLGIILSRTGDIEIAEPDRISPNLLILTEKNLDAKADGSDAPGIDQYLQLLKREFGISRLLVEGGPTINHALFHRNLVDELFLTLAPKVYGGNDPTLSSGEALPDPVPQLALRSAFLCENELFLRYTSKRGPENTINFR